SKLREDQVPWSCHAVPRNTKALFAGIPMVELEHRGQDDAPATETCPSHVLDRALPLCERHNPSRTRPRPYRAPVTAQIGPETAAFLPRRQLADTTSVPLFR